MAGRRRATLGRSRAEDQARRIGREVRLARTTLALSRAEVAKRARVSESTVERVEGGSASAQVGTVTAVAAAVGLDLVLKAYPGRSVSLRDSGQLELAEAIRLVAAPGWRVGLEVPAGEYGRSADLVQYGADEVQHYEIERAATDFQAQYRSAQQKRDVLAAGERRPVRLVMVVEDTRRNREAFRRHDALIRSQLPATTREVVASLRTGRPLGRDGLLWLRRPARPRKGG